MQYAANYSNHIKLDNFDEIIIIYDRQDEQLLPFLQKHKNKHIILSIEKVMEFIVAQEVEKLNAIYEIAPNFSIRFCGLCKFEEVKNEVFLECLSKLTVPYFFGFLITNFDQLHYVINLGAKSVYLTEEMCFNLVSAKRICKAHQVQIRAFPNVAQSAVKQTPALKKFFIRPEDVKHYEDCIDILEFWGPIDKQYVLYKIYSKGRWFGDLSEIILDLDAGFDSRVILPVFAEMRKDCGRVCVKGEQCRVCDRILDIGERFRQRHLIIKTKKQH